MRIELKDFQEIAVSKLIKHSINAKNEVRDGDLQAIVLSSPTGSGKTIITTALLEKILIGDETYAADGEATFLWLSHSPELNIQSRDKILEQSSFFKEQDLIIIEPPFSQEKLEAGKIYFLNTQKLGKDALLTKTGDGQEHTIWSTIENTTKTKAGHFYVIIDEAHRGMNVSTREANKAQSIIQKFIFGDPLVGLSPLDIIIGISATPERFAKLIGGSSRIKREYNIPPSAVRESGLLKDKIVLYCPETNEPSDWTLLTEAVRSWKKQRDSWKVYCENQAIEPVEPILVIQVEDRTEDRVTRTDLTQLMNILDREAGPFSPGEIVHCFEEDSEISSNGFSIQKIEPSRIENDPYAKVVIFKMALTTGWDCPRAEVMMSFRRAQDDTLIAQLVGRMVRTPLARRIEGSDILNKVSLYLPHYNPEGLGSIIGKLSDPENAPPTEIVEGSRLTTVSKDASHEALFWILESIPSYYVETITKISNVRRLVKLGRLLTFDEINPQAWDDSKEFVVSILSDELNRMRTDVAFQERYRANQSIEVREVQIEAGEWRAVDEQRVFSVTTTPENIDNLFEACGRTLGEGLHKEFWRVKSDRLDPQRVKLELFGLLQEEAVWEKLERDAQTKLGALFKAHEDQISALSSSKKEEYNRIRRRAKEPQPVSIIFPPSFEVVKEEPQWRDHLYVDDNGNFGWNANGWERLVLEKEQEAGNLIAWMRNMPRKQWSLCIPYRHRGEDKPLYPDIIGFRNEGDEIKVDVLDPHDIGLPDAVDKAVGLARFAQKHGDYFGRIEMIIVGKNEEIMRLDVNKEEIRDKVLKVAHQAHLEALFEWAKTR